MEKLQITRWDDADCNERMFRSDAYGARLLKSGRFGADMIRFPAGGRVGRHTHPGQHMLFVISGDGWVSVELPRFNGRYRLQAGVCYLIPGNIPHAIDADTELTIISVADDHRDVASSERLDVVPE